MSKKRILTDAEKRHVQDTQMTIERARFPDHIISIFVKHETDEDGNPLWTVTKTRETEKPKGWKP